MLSFQDAAGQNARTAELSTVTLSIITIFTVFHMNKMDLYWLQGTQRNCLLNFFSSDANSGFKVADERSSTTLFSCVHFLGSLKLEFASGCQGAGRRHCTRTPASHKFSQTFPLLQDIVGEMIVHELMSSNADFPC